MMSKAYNMGIPLSVVECQQQLWLGIARTTQLAFPFGHLTNGCGKDACEFAVAAAARAE